MPAYLLHVCVGDQSVAVQLLYEAGLLFRKSLALVAGKPSGVLVDDLLLGAVDVCAPPALHVHLQTRHADDDVLGEVQHGGLDVPAEIPREGRGLDSTHGPIHTVAVPQHVLDVLRGVAPLLRVGLCIDFAEGFGKIFGGFHLGKPAGKPALVVVEHPEEVVLLEAGYVLPSDGMGAPPRRLHHVGHGFVQHLGNPIRLLLVGNFGQSRLDHLLHRLRVKNTPESLVGKLRVFVEVKDGVGVFLLQRLKPLLKMPPGIPLVQRVEVFTVDDLALLVLPLNEIIPVPMVGEVVVDVPNLGTELLNGHVSHLAHPGKTVVGAHEVVVEAHPDFAHGLFHGVGPGLPGKPFVVALIPFWIGLDGGAPALQLFVRQELVDALKLGNLLAVIVPDQFFQLVHVLAGKFVLSEQRRDFLKAAGAFRRPFILPSDLTVVHGLEAGEPLRHPVRQHENPLHERHVAGLSKDASNPRIVLGKVHGILGTHAGDVADIFDVPQGGQRLVFYPSLLYIFLTALPPLAL